jgi:hypothetical protein
VVAGRIVLKELELELEFEIEIEKDGSTCEISP